MERIEANMYAYTPIAYLFDIFYFHTDNSERAFYKELVKVIEESDVILEVLDARDPLGTRCVDMEKMVMKSGHEKHLVLLLNKIGNFCLPFSLSLVGIYMDMYTHISPIYIIKFFTEIH